MSLTCICCKTLEHILVSNINKDLALDCILANCQHGFLSQRSCETQLIQFVHDTISNLDEAVNRGHKQTDLIIKDFASAFDKVPHRRLLHKLDYEGCSNMNASGFITFFTYMLRQNGKHFYKGLYVTFKLAPDLKTNTAYLSSYSPWNKGHVSILTNLMF